MSLFTSNTTRRYSCKLLRHYNLPAEGFEPTHPCGYQILSLARLPISPRRLIEGMTLVAFCIHAKQRVKIILTRP